MQPMPWGDTTLATSFDMLRVEIQHVIAVLVWLLVIGLATAAGCWCCGYAVRATWLKAGPPRRHLRRAARASVPVPVTGEGIAAKTVSPADSGAVAAAVTCTDPLAVEAARGIAQLEAFLAAH